MKYRLILSDVEAIRFTGHNLKEIEVLCKADDVKVISSNEKRSIIAITKNGRTRRARNGMYVMVKDNGNVYTLPAGKFKEKYIKL